MFTLLRTPFFPHLFFSSNYLIEIQDAVVKSSLEILGKTFWRSSSRAVFKDRDYILTLSNERCVKITHSYSDLNVVEINYVTKWLNKLINKEHFFLFFFWNNISEAIFGLHIVLIGYQSYALQNANTLGVKIIKKSKKKGIWAVGARAAFLVGLWHEIASCATCSPTQRMASH